MTSDTGGRLLVPVAESVTLRQTVAYAVEEARTAARDGADAAVHFVHPEAWRTGDPTFEAGAEADLDLLERVIVWAESDLESDESGPEDSAPTVALETAVIGQDRYLFSPDDYASALGEYAEANELDRIVIDPEYNPVGSSPLLDPLASALRRADLSVEEAPVEREARRGALATTGSLQQYVAVFATSLLFYLVLAWFGGALDLVTGTVSATIVAVALGRISLRRALEPATAVRRAARFLIYVPYLVWEIVKANLSLAVAILHPRLPIEPRLVGFRAAVWGDLPVTTLANSITLTPGTLTVDVTEREFYVHTLTTGARDDLFDGALERAVRFVFYGRAASRIPSPIERSDVRYHDELRQDDGPADGEAPTDEDGEAGDSP